MNSWTLSAYIFNIVYLVVYVFIIFYRKKKKGLSLKLK